MEGYYYAHQKKEENGEVLLQVPMIVSPEDELVEGMRVRYEWIGRYRLPCVLVWIPESYYLYHRRDLEAQAKAHSRQERCLIPDPAVPGSRIMCPEHNSCRECPRCRDWSCDNGHDLSLEGLLSDVDEAAVPEFPSAEAGPAETALERDSMEQLSGILDRIGRLLEARKPRYALIFAELRKGETNASEIARRCGLKRNRTLEDVARVQALSREFYRVLSDASAR